MSTVKIFLYFFLFADFFICFAKARIAQSGLLLISDIFADCGRSAKPLPQYGFEFYVYFRRFSHRMRILLSYFPVYCKKG